MKKYKYKKIKLPNGTTKDEHRLIIESYLGRKLSKSEVVHHLDGNKRNNNIENLKLMSLKEHSTMHRTGSATSSETRKKLSEINMRKPTRAKLTISQVRELKSKISLGESKKELASFYKLNVATIYKISSGKIWPNIN